MFHVLPYKDAYPEIAQGVFIAPGAAIIGDVEIGERSSIWFNTVVRGDEHSIRIGSETNIQDNSTLHVTGGKFSLTVGNRVTIGHRVVVHGCVIEDDCLIGIGAIILDGARIGEGSLVAAGAVVRQGFEVPPNSLVMGVPATIKTVLSEEQQKEIREAGSHYIELASEYMNPSSEKNVLGFLG
jgi:carbonic anhydrase/acetyltransferase-like protein (isoleucine patch superfamily)